MVSPQDIDMIVFAEILIEKLSDSQISEIIQAVMDRYENDCCPICGLERLPFDKKSGKRLAYMDDISHERLRKMDDVEWHDMHEVSCMVTLLEEMRDLRKKAED